MKKPFNKIYNLWLLICFIYLGYVLFNNYQDPILWMETKARLANPWYYIPMMAIFSGWIVFALNCFRRAKTSQKQLEMMQGIAKSVADGIVKGAEESKLMQENEIPDDESISKYYKMYCKKFELDNANKWNTAEPITFEWWEKCAKNDFEEEQVGGVCWQFMIAMTSDMFSFDPNTGQATMMRFRDYEKLIEEEDKPN